MIPDNLIRLVRNDGRVAPLYLTEREEPWIRVAVGSFQRWEGASLRDVEAWMDDLVSECVAMGGHPTAVRGVLEVVLSFWPARVVSAARPSEIRLCVFDLAARGLGYDEAIRSAAEKLCIAPETVIPSLFADRPGSRRLTRPDQSPDATQVRKEYNLTLLRSLVRRSAAITARANPLVWADSPIHKRLICTCQTEEPWMRLELSGPTALFRHTTRYGHLLDAFLLHLVNAQPWQLQAYCDWMGKQVVVHACHRDPIARHPVFKPPREDACIRRLMRDLRRLGTPWIAQPSTRALVAKRSILFPDLELTNGPHKAWVEWVTYHTDGSIRAKLEGLAIAGISTYLLCVDQSLSCGKPIPYHDNIMLFDKRPDPCEVLQRIHRLVTSHPTLASMP